MNLANGTSSASSAAGKIKAQKTPGPLKVQFDSFESKLPEFLIPKTSSRRNDTQPYSKYVSRDLTPSSTGESRNLQKSGFLKSNKLCSSSPLHSQTFSVESLNHCSKYKDHEQRRAFENTCEDDSEHGKSMKSSKFPQFVEAEFIKEKSPVKKESVTEKKLQASIEVKSRVKERNRNERKVRKTQMQAEKYQEEQDILSKARTEVEIKKAQEQALRYVIAAERERQRILRSSSNSVNEYTILEQSPPYHEHLNYNLDLVSYDERFSPVLRVNCQLVSGDYELAQAIAKFADFKILPAGTDLWCISHIDDRNFENLIPLLIPVTENNTVAQS